MDQFKWAAKKKRFGKREALQKDLSQFSFTLRKVTIKNGGFDEERAEDYAFRAIIASENWRSIERVSFERSVNRRTKEKAKIIKKHNNKGKGSCVNLMCQVESLKC